MRQQFLLALLLIAAASTAQTDTFPNNWMGTWKGELLWYKNSTGNPQAVPMELQIGQADSAHHFTWQIKYGTAAADLRPYILKPADKQLGHWIIDEQNGILLDQFWIGNKLSGAFTVSGKMIFNNYSVQGDTMQVEFYTIKNKPLTSSGTGTEEIPSVDSYQMTGYQKAILFRQK